MNAQEYMTGRCTLCGAAFAPEGDGMLRDSFVQGCACTNAGVVVEYDSPEARECGQCGGCLGILGTLGSRTHYQCRDCGAAYSERQC